MERRIGEVNRFTVGWTAYFCFADTHLPFERLDKWLRRRLRQIRWKEWKRPKTRYRSLRALGLPERDCREVAASQKGYWAISHSPQLQRALRNAYWHKTMGLKGFLDPTAASGHAERTARCETRMPGGVGVAGVSPAPTRFHRQRDDARAS